MNKKRLPLILLISIVLFSGCTLEEPSQSNKEPQQEMTEESKTAFDIIQTNNIHHLPETR